MPADSFHGDGLPGEGKQRGPKDRDEPSRERSRHDRQDASRGGGARRRRRVKPGLPANSHMWLTNAQRAALGSQRQCRSSPEVGPTLLARGGPHPAGADLAHPVEKEGRGRDSELLARSATLCPWQPQAFNLCEWRNTLARQVQPPLSHSYTNFYC